MEKELVTRLCDMINSTDTEMRNLAIVIFTQSTKDYQDYWDLRTAFSPALYLQDPQRAVFNQLFNHTDPDTRDPVFRKELEKKRQRDRGFDSTKKLGRRDDMQRTCVIIGKDK